MLHAQQPLCGWQSWVGSQARQAAPPAPHAESALPDSQPLASQQPVGHEAGLHSQRPEAQLSPAGQATPASQPPVEPPEDEPPEDEPPEPVATQAPLRQISFGAHPERQAEA